MARRLPSLGGLEDALGQLITMDQVEELGWAAAGGALGSVAMSFIRPQLAKVPVLGGYPNVVEILAGAVAARMAMEVNDALAHGIAGATVGRSAAKLLLGMMNRPLDGLHATPEDVELAQSDQLGPPSDDLVLEAMGEAEAMPEFGGSIEPDAALSYLS